MKLRNSWSRGCGSVGGGAEGGGLLCAWAPPLDPLIQIVFWPCSFLALHLARYEDFMPNKRKLNLQLRKILHISWSLRHVSGTNDLFVSTYIFSSFKFPMRSQDKNDPRVHFASLDKVMFQKQAGRKCSASSCVEIVPHPSKWPIIRLILCQPFKITN